MEHNDDAPFEPLIASFGTLDCLIWETNGSGVFSFNSIYKWLVSKWEDCVQELRLIWNNEAPHRVHLFGWQEWNGQVKTRDLLSYIGAIAYPGQVFCPLCSQDNEIVDDVMLLCPTVWVV